jgi:hypothetical protein
MEVCWFIPWQVNYTLCMEEDCLVQAVAKLEQHTFVPASAQTLSLQKV